MNGRRGATESYKWYDSSGYLIKVSFSEDGLISRKQFYDKDTFPNAADISYYLNGTVSVWKWNWFGDGKPICGVYYDSMGRFDTFNGRPFINCIKSENGYFIVRTVKPPNINSVLSLEIFNNEEKIDSITYELSCNDSICYAYVGKYGEFTFQPDHKIILSYLIVDSSSAHVSNVNYAIQLDRKKYTYIKIK